MNTKSKKIEFGNVEIGSDEFSPRAVKVRVTTLIDQDVLDKFKCLAKKKGQRYQTLLNDLLRQFVENSENRIKVRVLNERAVREIVREELKKRA